MTMRQRKRAYHACMFDRWTLRTGRRTRRMVGMWRNCGWAYL